MVLWAWSAMYDCGIFTYFFEPSKFGISKLDASKRTGSNRYIIIINNKCIAVTCYIDLYNYSMHQNLALRFLKTFFILNSAEHDIYPAHKCLNANNCWHLNILLA